MDDDPGYDLQPVDINPFAAVPKAGQTVPPINARPMTGQAAMSALGVPDISNMTPEEQQMFALGAVPMLAAGPEARVAEEVAAEAAPAVARGIKAFHGSPYDFNAFDLSKIGTGEGAQSYGHGLYFAENPAVAQDYKSRLGILANVNDSHEANTALYYLRQNGNNKKAAIEDLRQSVGGPLSDDHPLIRAIEDFDPGRMYEVSINADPEHFLDWDKPLSEQHPKVQEAITPLIKQIETANPNYKVGAGVGRAGNPTGSDLAAVRGIEQQLRQAGIPGIKYLDQGSRAAPDQMADLTDRISNPARWPADQAARAAQISADTAKLNKLKSPTSNYVVFDDKLIDIIKKYGMAGLVAGGASHFQTQPVDHQPEFEEGFAKGGAVKGLATKHQANYRGGTGRYHCAICTMFVKPSSCTSVRGHISPRALCDFYEPKGNGERIVDNRYDVITGANSSKKPTGPIFIDRHIPEWSPKLRTKTGKRVRLWTYLSIHEDDEQKHMEAGDSYDQAHEKATTAERKKAEADGVDWKAYTEEIDNYLVHVERERVGRKPPVPLHVKPEAALKDEGHHHSSHKKPHRAEGGRLPSKTPPPQWDPPVIPDQWAQALPLDTQRAIGRNTLRDRMMQNMGIDPVYQFERHDDTATADQAARQNQFGGPATADQLRAAGNQMERNLDTYQQEFGIEPEQKDI